MTISLFISNMYQTFCYTFAILSGITSIVFILTIFTQKEVQGSYSLDKCGLTSRQVDYSKSTWHLEKRLCTCAHTPIVMEVCAMGIKERDLVIQTQLFANWWKLWHMTYSCCLNLQCFQFSSVLFSISLIKGKESWKDLFLLLSHIRDDLMYAFYFKYAVLYQLRRGTLIGTDCQKELWGNLG